MKKWTAAIGVTLLICVVLSFFTGFAKECSDIRAQMLRVHILAASDSNEDQAVKLAVRDRVVAETGALFAAASDKETALETARKHLQTIEAAAQQTVWDCGKTQKVEATLCRMYFATRTYEDFTLPAGEYDAVRVTIGEAEGKNWWCVLFPSLCLPGAQPKEELTEVLTPTGEEIVTCSEQYQVRFAVLEWWESLKQWVSSWFSGK